MNHSPDHPLQRLGRLLSDHEAPLCGHVDGLATFWSCLARPVAKEIYYSLGASCRSAYDRRCRPNLYERVQMDIYVPVKPQQLEESHARTETP